MKERERDREIQRGRKGMKKRESEGENTSLKKMLIHMREREGREKRVDYSNKIYVSLYTNLE